MEDMETAEADSTSLITKQEVGVADQEETENVEDDDEARSEATFRYTIENFSTVRDSCLSESCVIRNLPWKIMIMQRDVKPQERGTPKSVGYFLQCNGESEHSNWSCQASADLRLINQRDNTKFSRKISHLFYSKENDWGFSHYMLWGDVQDPEKGYIKDDTVILEVRVSADAPHGVSWDSKKHTGYVGLKNQGATCYMNSLLQVLYFTNFLRRAVYKMPTESDDSQKSVGLALQRVFYELQFMDKPVGTKKLTKSFGWEALDSFMQHDVQEFLRVLLDKLETKMKTTCVEGTIPKLFEGKMISYIRCKNVDYKSTRTESFYDIQLNIKGKKSIEESFRDYIQTESLDGENKYDAGSYGLQDAEKGILFEKFPPVLHLHLMRFQYDPVTDCSIKFNDRCEFPELLDLSPYCQAKDGKMEDKSDYQYLLHAVLVHSGDNNGGHYVVFINPMGDGKWCKFDDDVVSRCSKKEAIDHNFGGEGEELMNTKHCTSAYMLVYINQARCQTEILGTIGDKDIPEALTERLQEEKKIEMIRRKEKNEAHLYMLVRVLVEDNFHGHQGNDLFDPEFVTPIEFRIKKASTLREFLSSVSEDMRWPLEKLRPWPLTHRTNQTLRPALVELEDGDRTMLDVSENANPWSIFMELLAPDIPRPLPTFDKDQDVMLFFKYYCPRTKKIHYIGHLYLAITTKLTSVLPKLCELASIAPPENNKLMLWEEIKPNMLERIEDVGQPLEHILEELMDGDIIVFQEEPPVGHNLVGHPNYMELPTARDYFRDLFYKVEVTFCDKNKANDLGFSLELSQRMHYEELSKRVATHLETDPYLIQFFKSQSYREGPGHPLRCNFEGSLKDLLVYFRPKQPKKIYYQTLQIPINELENKRQFKCLWISFNLRDERELVLYPSRNATVGDMLGEAKKDSNLEWAEEGGTKTLRMVEIISNKIFSIARHETTLESLQQGGTKTYRLEEVPADQLDMEEETELLVPVAHYTKEIFSTFGSPFLIRLKVGETVGEVKARLQERLGVPDKEWEKYRVSFVILGKPHYVEEDDKTVNTKEFRGMSMLGAPQSGRPWIGLEHSNKANKRGRYNYLEKAIKIYN